MFKRRRRWGAKDDRWTVHRERCRLDESAIPSKLKEEQTIGVVVEKAIAGLLSRESSWTGELGREWPSLVGPTVAQHTRPGRLDGKLLFIYVDSAVWLNELKRFSQGSIVEKIQGRFGVERVKAVRLVPDPGDAP